MSHKLKIIAKHKLFQNNETFQGESKLPRAFRAFNFTQTTSTFTREGFLLAFLVCWIFILCKNVVGSQKFAFLIKKSLSNKQQMFFWWITYFLKTLNPNKKQQKRRSSGKSGEIYQMVEYLLADVNNVEGTRDGVFHTWINNQHNKTCNFFLFAIICGADKESWWK